MFHGNRGNMAQFDGNTPDGSPDGETYAKAGRHRFWTALMASIGAFCAVVAWLYAKELGISGQKAEITGVGVYGGENIFPVGFDGETFHIAERQFINIARSAQSEVTSIELAVPWPPPKLAFLTSDQRPARTLSLHDGLFISIQRRTSSVSAEERIKGIYPIYYDGAADTGPADLVRQGFRKGTVYEDQELYVGRSDAASAHYLCFLRDEHLAPALCRGERASGDRFTAVYRFHRSHLGDWQSIEDTLTDVLAQIRPPQGN